MYNGGGHPTTRSDAAGRPASQAATQATRHAGAQQSVRSNLRKDNFVFPGKKGKRVKVAGKQENHILQSP